VLCATGVRLVEQPKKIGTTERHLSLKLVQGQTRIRGVGFGHAEWAEELAAAGGPLDIAYRPVINEYRGRHSVEVQLVDWRKSEVAT
jgi:single-stranded-DNA-specific exonuclease